MTVLRKIYKLKLITMFVLLSCSGVKILAQNKTPDYWQCNNKVGGSWVFGLAPAGCDVSAFGEDQYVWNTYKPVVFDERVTPAEERQSYMDEMAKVLVEASTLYIQKRKPEVSASEVDGFIRAAFTMAHQESYWTHYRLYSDLRLKMMRGDLGHGHGLMQVDDRWHFLAIKNGNGWKLIDNFIYAFELFYSAWENAAKASCVTNPSDYRMRARAAYSAYNGGDSKICRWTNPSDKWAKNDQGFVDKYDRQAWQSYILNQGTKSVVNVECLMSGQENCPLRSGVNDNDVPVEGRLYQSSAQEVCLLKDQAFQCVVNTRDVACLQKWAGGTADDITQMTTRMESTFTKNNRDRHQLCLSLEGTGLHDVGAIIKLNKDITFRGTPAGTSLGLVPGKTVLQIFDFELRDQYQGKRYYQVQWNNQWGYIYGGSFTDEKQWTDLTAEKPKDVLIATKLQKIRVLPSGGINLRDKIGGSILIRIPVGTNLTVKDVVILSESNDLYYQVEFKGKTGFIYSGRSLPEKTFNQWTSVVGG